VAPGLEHRKKCPPPLVCARILGHLLRLAPPGNGQEQVQRDTDLAKGHNGLMDLARYYLVYFLNSESLHFRYLAAEDSHWPVYNQA
jgi:hypothetical protein